MATERVITDADILELKARLGATMDAWVERLDQLQVPGPQPGRTSVPARATEPGGYARAPGRPSPGTRP